MSLLCAILRISRLCSQNHSGSFPEEMDLEVIGPMHNNNDNNNNDNNNIL